MDGGKRPTAWRRRALELALACAASVVLFGCPKGNLVVDAPTIEDANDQMTSCKVAKDPLNPIIIEWPATNKTQLQSKSTEGVVVVSYVGCHLKVLTGCDASGSYAFRGTQPARDTVKMSNESELSAKLPLGFVDLKGKLSGGNVLELELVAVGERVTRQAPAALSGSCEGATHYIRAMTVGAYALDAVGKGEAAIGVDVGGIGGEVGRKESRQQVNHSGSVEGCADYPGTMNEADVDANQCGAILQLSLQPLRQVGGGDVVTAGFGANLGPMGDVPTVSDSEIRITQTSLKDVDVTFLNLLQEAKRADKDESVNAQSKADKWGALCSYDGKNPIREAACKRRDEWTEVAEAERKREQRLAELRTQYQSDKAKLAQLLGMDEDIVSSDQKRAYKDEFEQVYAPYKDIVEVSPGGGAGDGTNPDGTDPAADGMDAAYAATLIAIDIAGGYTLNGLGTNSDTAFFGGDNTKSLLAFPAATSTSDRLKSESGALIRARLAFQATPGIFVGGLFRYAFLADYKPLTAGVSLALRPAVEGGLIPLLGFDVGYYTATGLQMQPMLEDGTPDGSLIDVSVAGASLEAYLGVGYLVQPFLSVGATAGVQGLLGLTRSALEKLPVSCTGASPATACNDLKSDQKSNGFAAYLEANMSAHF